MGKAICLPFPVSTNAMYRAVKGRSILSARARAWKELAGVEIMSQRPVKHKGPVSIYLEYTPPDKRRRDPDNHLKIVMDALVTSGVIEDDSAVIVKERREFWNDPDKAAAGVKATVKTWHSGPK